MGMKWEKAAINLRFQILLFIKAAKGSKRRTACFPEDSVYPDRLGLTGRACSSLKEQRKSLFQALSVLDISQSEPKTLLCPRAVTWTGFVKSWPCCHLRRTQCVYQGGASVCLVYPITSKQWQRISNPHGSIDYLKTEGQRSSVLSLNQS